MEFHHNYKRLSKRSIYGFNQDPSRDDAQMYCSDTCLLGAEVRDLV